MLTDNDEMPWGKHAGTKMQDVPASYLIYLFENRLCHGEVLAYIEENMEVLRMQVKQLNHKH